MQVPGTRKYCDACRAAANVRYCARCGGVEVANRRRYCDDCRYLRAQAPHAAAARNREIIERRNNGETLPALAAAYGITKQRVFQITLGRAE